MPPHPVGPARSPAVGAGGAGAVATCAPPPRITSIAAAIATARQARGGQAGAGMVTTCAPLPPSIAGGQADSLSRVQQYDAYLLQQTRRWDRRPGQSRHYGRRPVVGLDAFAPHAAPPFHLDLCKKLDESADLAGWGPSPSPSPFLPHSPRPTAAVLESATAMELVPRHPALSPVPMPHPTDPGRTSVYGRHPAYALLCQFPPLLPADTAPLGSGDHCQRLLIDRRGGRARPGPPAPAGGGGGGGGG